METSATVTPQPVSLQSVPFYPLPLPWCGKYAQCPLTFHPQSLSHSSIICLTAAMTVLSKTWTATWLCSLKHGHCLPFYSRTESKIPPVVQEVLHGDTLLHSWPHPSLMGSSHTTYLLLSFSFKTHCHLHTGLQHTHCRCLACLVPLQTPSFQVWVQASIPENSLPWPLVQARAPLAMFSLSWYLSTFVTRY